MKSCCSMSTGFQFCKKKSSGYQFHKNMCAYRWKWKYKSLSHVQFFATLWTIVHGIVQARILKWVAFPFFRRSSQPRDWTQVFWISGRFFYYLSHKGSPHKKGWVPKSWWFWTDSWEESGKDSWEEGPESPLDSKEIKPMNPRGS